MFLNDLQRIRGFLKCYALYKSTFYLLTYLLTYFDLMPWRRWRISALWQLHFRDCRSRFSNRLCHGRDCQHQGEADVVIHNLLLHCPTISFLAFLSDGCHVCVREVTNMCGSLWLSIRTTWPKHDRWRVLTTSTMSLSGARSFIMSVLRLWFLLEHPRIFLTIVLPSRKPGVNVCSPLSRSKSLHCTAVWTGLGCDIGLQGLLSLC